MRNKILIIVTIMFLVMFAFGIDVFARETISSANITVTSLKNEYNVGEKAEFVIRLNNLNATKGIIDFGASIEYNSSILKLLEIEGATGWSDNDNSSNIIGIIRSSNSATSEDIATIRFEVLKPATTTTLSIKLNNVDISNGGGYKINSVSSNQITIKVAETVNPPKEEEDTPPTQGGGSESGGNTGNQGQTTNPPSTGDETNQGGSQGGGSQGGSSGNGSSGTGGSSGSSSSGTSGNSGSSSSGTGGSSGSSSSGTSGNSGNDSSETSGDLENGSSDSGEDSKSNSSELGDSLDNDSSELTGGTNNDASDLLNDDNGKDTIIPQLGVSNILQIAIIVAIVIAVILFVKIKVLDKKIKKDRTKK